MRRAEAVLLKAVILAAGRGTRMGGLTKYMPKPMVRIGGKPLLEHILGRMIAAGVTDFVFVTNYLSEKIREHFGDGARFGARIEYAEQTESYGTGVALLSAKKLAGDGLLMLTFADIVTATQTYTQAIDVYKDLRGAGVVTLNWVDDPCNGAAVVVDDAGTIGRVVEKPPKGVSSWHSAGVFVFDPIVFDYLEQLSPSSRGEYELADALNGMIDDGLMLYPSYLDGDWLDVGTAEALAAAEKMLA